MPWPAQHRAQRSGVHQSGVCPLHVAEFVDAEQIEAAVAGDGLGQLAFIGGLDQLVDQFRGQGVVDPIALLCRSGAELDQQVRLAVLNYLFVTPVDLGETELPAVDAERLARQVVAELLHDDHRDRHAGVHAERLASWSGPVPPPMLPDMITPTFDGGTPATFNGVEKRNL
jgi:hypothetical protein